MIDLDRHDETGYIKWFDPVAFFDEINFLLFEGRKVDSCTIPILQVRFAFYEELAIKGGLIPAREIPRILSGKKFFEPEDIETEPEEDLENKDVVVEVIKKRVDIPKKIPVIKSEEKLPFDISKLKLNIPPKSKA